MENVLLKKQVSMDGVLVGMVASWMGRMVNSKFLIWAISLDMKLFDEGSPLSLGSLLCFEENCVFTREMIVFNREHVLMLEEDFLLIIILLPGIKYASWDTSGTNKKEQFAGVACVVCLMRP